MKGTTMLTLGAAAAGGLWLYNRSGSIKSTAKDVQKDIDRNIDTSGLKKDLKKDIDKRI